MTLLPPYLNAFIQKNGRAQNVVKNKFNEVGHKLEHVAQLEKIVLVVQAVKKATG